MKVLPLVACIDLSPGMYPDAAIPAGFPAVQVLPPSFMSQLSNYPRQFLLIFFAPNSNSHGTSPFGHPSQRILLSRKHQDFLKDSLLTSWPPQASKDAEDQSLQWLLVLEAALPTQAGWGYKEKATSNGGCSLLWLQSGWYWLFMFRYQHQCS